MGSEDKGVARFAVGSANDAKEYVYSQGDGWCAVNSSGDMIPLAKVPIASLPLLEKPLVELEAELASVARTFGADLAFPFLLVVEAAIAQGHEYWISRAFQWVCDAKLSSRPWADLALEDFDAVAKNKKYSQELRHAVQRARTVAKSHR